jgi:hypothetical protein
LSRSSLNDRHDVSGKLRFLLVVDLVLLKEQETLSLDFDIVLLLVEFAQVARRARIERSRFLLLAFLLFLVFLGAPNLVDIKELDSDDVAFKSAITILGPTNVNIGIKRIDRYVGIGPVALVLR